MITVRNVASRASLSHLGRIAQHERIVSHPLQVALAHFLCYSAESEVLHSLDDTFVMSVVGRNCGFQSAHVYCFTAHSRSSVKHLLTHGPHEQVACLHCSLHST